jgi:ATP-binding cassette subfamily B protein
VEKTHGPHRGAIFVPGMRLLGSYAKTHPVPFSLAVLGASLFSVFSVGGSIVLGRVIDDVVLPGFEEGVATSALLTTGVVIVGMSLLRAAGVVMRRYFGAMTTDRQQATWRSQLSDRFVSVPMSFFKERPTGELLAHADTDVETATMAMQPLPMTLGVVVLFAAAIISLLAADLWLLLVVVSLFPILILANRVYSHRVIVPAADVQEALGVVSSVVHESVDGALVVKTLGRERAEVERLEREADVLRSARLRFGRLRATFEPSLEAIPNLGVVALLAVGAWRVSEGGATAGEVVQAMLLLQILIFPMRVMGFLLEELPRSLVAADRIRDVLTEPDDVDGSTSEELPEGPLTLSLEDVWFSHGPDAVLEGVTFEVGPGEVVALVGATGSGKSTLAQLLFRLVRPSRGHIRLGGLDVAGVPADVLSSTAALVFQETFLFADSVEVNIDPDGVFGHDRVRDAARVARAGEFIEAMPQGYSTVVGERGVTLSGGQRQRVALARALARQPRFLFLDDATSAVDPTIERQILDGLGEEIATTTLIVAHRVSTIRLAHRVIYLENGKVAASGSHEELLANPSYEALVRAYEDAS